jgi:hypothetical protein
MIIWIDAQLSPSLPHPYNCFHYLLDATIQCIPGFLSEELVYVVVNFGKYQHFKMFSVFVHRHSPFIIMICNFRKARISPITSFHTFSGYFSEATKSRIHAYHREILYLRKLIPELIPQLFSSHYCGKGTISPIHPRGNYRPPETHQFLLIHATSN